MTASTRRLLVAVVMVLLSLLSAIPTKAQNKAGIIVQPNAAQPLRLRVTIRSKAGTRTTIYRSDLPWMPGHSMILVAALPNGLSLDQNILAGDPTPERISLNPGESVSGDIDLKGVFKNIDSLIEKHDIHLFWAYRSPEGLGLPKWSGGWILLPQESPRRAPGK
ncbi:MAG TPA: hypothetical protein VFV92_13105 [Candidatus Bathyarchaeia archaeon]|nr:hypothetical protein [Candidatus Bathyarchaeia archaeon]